MLKTYLCLHAIVIKMGYQQMHLGEVRQLMSDKSFRDALM